MPGRPDWSDNMCVRHTRDQSNRINYPGARIIRGRTAHLTGTPTAAAAATGWLCSIRSTRHGGWWCQWRRWRCRWRWQWRWRLWEAHAQKSGIRIGPIWLILFEIDRNERKKAAPTTRPYPAGADVLGPREFRISTLGGSCCSTAVHITRKTISKCNLYYTRDELWNAYRDSSALKAKS